MDNNGVKNHPYHKSMSPWLYEALKIPGIHYKVAKWCRIFETSSCQLTKKQCVFFCLVFLLGTSTVCERVTWANYRDQLLVNPHKMVVFRIKKIHPPKTASSPTVAWFTGKSPANEKEPIILETSHFLLNHDNGRKGIV